MGKKLKTVIGINNVPPGKKIYKIETRYLAYNKKDYPYDKHYPISTFSNKEFMKVIIQKLSPPASERNFADDLLKYANENDNEIYYKRIDYYSFYEKEKPMSETILVKESFVIEQDTENIIVEPGDRIQFFNEEDYKYICMACGYETSSMPDNYICPVCNAPIQPMLENRKKEAVDIKKVIKDLQGNFAGSNEDQMKSVQLLKGLATSDDPLSNKFMKALDKETTRISKEILKEGE